MKNAGMICLFLSALTAFSSFRRIVLGNALEEGNPSYNLGVLTVAVIVPLVFLVAGVAFLYKAKHRDRD